jgi:hypothetical protein
MSAVKEAMEAAWEKTLAAEEIAVDAGVLLRCEVHDVVYDNQGDPADAYRLGNYRFTNGQLGGVFTDRREMTDTIQAAIAESAEECGYCRKVFSY